MFPYTDPVGLNFLGNAAAESNYRRILDTEYDRTARRTDSAITWLEAFDAVPAAQKDVVTVSWLAYPLTAGVPDSEIDRDRFAHQDEYVEWRVEKAGGGVQQITFSTEFPEYLQAFAEVSHADLVTAIQQLDPGANPTPKDLYGVNAAPADPRARALSFRQNLPDNPWNNGKQGFLCLTQQFNTLGALFGLLVECGVDRSPQSVDDTCSLVQNACGPGRASDPAVCAAAQNASRQDLCFSPVDPAGIRIVKLEGAWELGGAPFDPNDFANNQGIWTLARGNRRGVLRPAAGLRCDGNPITTGAQVARVVRVAADVLAAKSARLPEWARTGNEGIGRGVA